MSLPPLPQFAIRRPDGKVGVFDLVENERYDDGAETTDHPIEAGADVTDHIRRNPILFSVDVVMTTYPLASQNQLGVPGWERVQDVLLFLNGCFQKPLIVQTTFRGVLTNCVLISSPQERVGADGMMRIPLRFKQIRLASSETVPVSGLAQPPPAARPALATAVDLGVQGGTDALTALGPAGVARDTSVLKSISLTLGL